MKAVELVANPQVRLIDIGLKCAFGLKSIRATKLGQVPTAYIRLRMRAGFLAAALALEIQTKLRRTQ